MAMRSLIFKEQPAISIPAGNYNGFNFVAGNKYVGAGIGNTVINFAPNSGINNGMGIHFTGDNLAVSGVTFKGGGWFFDKPAGHNTGINFDNNEYLMTSGECICFTSGIASSNFTNSHFTGPSYGIYGYNYYGLVISGNDFDHCDAGAHIAAFGDSVKMLVERNWIHGAKHMGFEFQGGATGDVLQDNWFEDPIYTTNFHDQDNSMAYSFPLDASTNTLIQHNVVISHNKADGLGCRIAIECGGANTKVLNNYIETTNAGIACTDGNGNCSVLAQNNKIVAAAPNNAIQRANGPTGDLQNINNGPNTVLDIDLIARGHPLRGGGFAGSGPVVTPTSFIATGTFTAAVGSDGGAIATFNFTNVPVGTTQIKVDAVASQGTTDPRGIFSKTFPFNNPLTVPSQTPGYQESYTLTALSATNAALGTAKFGFSANFPGSSTITWPPVPVQPTDIAAQLAAAQFQIAALQKQVADLTAQNTTLNAAYTALQVKVQNFINAIK